MSSEIPNLIIIGDIAYDTNEFFYEDGTKKIVVNNGGSSIYAGVPSSLFYRVGLVSKAGKDYDINILKDYNIDLRGVQQIENEKTTRFYNILKTKDRQERETKSEYNSKLATTFKDIPQEFLKASFFYIATMPPKIQLNIIEEIKNYNPKAIIGVDTFEQYSDMPETIETFNITDIAFIDREFTNLLKCNARTKIIKLGKTGCILKTDKGIERVPATVLENVIDKTGAGDCLNGTFMNLLANGYSEKEALKKAVKVATISIKDFGILNIKNRLDRTIEEYHR